MSTPGVGGAGISLPAHTIERIARGEAVLFLGSGASFSARTPDGKPAPTSATLRDAMCDAYLGGEAKDRSLANVGDLVKATVGIIEMQRFISDLLEPLQPTNAHRLLPKFRWKAIFTTNYDLTIERAYSEAKGIMQALRPILSDEDQIGPIISSPPEFDTFRQKSHRFCRAD